MAQSNGGVTVFVRVVVRNRKTIEELHDLVDELRELGEDMPWTSAGELAERLAAVVKELPVVSAG